MDNKTQRPLAGRKHIAEEFNSYARKVMPANAPATQRIETRRAFYAGASAAYFLLHRAVVYSPQLDPEAPAIFDAVEHEITSFAQDVNGGRA